MDIRLNGLRRFIETIKTIKLWRRLFGWSAVKNQLVDAVADLQQLLTSHENINDQLQNQRQQITNLTKDLTLAREKALEVEFREEGRQAEHRQQAATLKAIQDRITADREAERQAAHAREIDRLDNMRFTWSNHQTAVREALKTLCQRHTIEFIEKVPFKGDPDNTVKIAGEYIVFDAKSPRSDDLTNFPAYLKDQSEKVKKYTGEDNVKKWVFFVVPENTLSHIGTYVHHLADYQVFVVAANSLEPILLSLQRVEAYEFADQLSPEDRENICRILGKFAHLSKRRIQVDAFFIGQFMELARKCEHDLPADILDETIEFEKAEVLNPPVERRGKAIPMADLEKVAARAIAEAGNPPTLFANSSPDSLAPPSTPAPPPLPSRSPTPQPQP